MRDPEDSVIGIEHAKFSAVANDLRLEGVTLLLYVNVDHYAIGFCLCAKGTVHAACRRSALVSKNTVSLLLGMYPLFPGHGNIPF